MDHIRPFSEGDTLAVARLHQAVFKPLGRTHAGAMDAYRSYFDHVFLRSPFYDPRLPSLVYEDDQQRIVGFLGVVPRRVAMNGRRFQAAVSSQFIVDPSGPVGLVAVGLAKAFLEGPQDLSIADDATDVSRRIWEALGGASIGLLSLHWTRPLRVARLAVSMMRGRSGASPIGMLGRPLATIVDAVATRWPRSHFYLAPRRGCASDLDAATISSAPAIAAEHRSLHVERDERTCAWLLERAAQTRPGGRLVKTVLHDGQRMLGWYIWHADRTGAAELLELKATPASIGDVLDHLFHDAWRLGAAAISGRLEPRFVQALSDKHCLFHRRGPWVLAHARRPELLHAFQAGNVSFSRLDGEWALAF